jgi:hypothetical protein
MIGAGVESVWGYGDLQGVDRCWVIALGTNDALYNPVSTFQPAIAALMAHIPPNEPVWWVDVAVANGDAVNAEVGVPLVGWHPAPDELVPDGVHLTDAGATRWADVVFASIAGR